MEFESTIKDIITIIQEEGQDLLIPDITFDGMPGILSLDDKGEEEFELTFTTSGLIGGVPTLRMTFNGDSDDVKLKIFFEAKFLDNKWVRGDIYLLQRVFKKQLLLKEKGEFKSCCVCNDICFRQTPCNHDVCIRCLCNILPYKFEVKCPICRAVIPPQQGQEPIQDVEDL